VLQCVAVCCSMLQSKNQLSVLQCVVVCAFVAVCELSVLQCGVVCAYVAG